MSGRTIRALLKKDLALFVSNRFYFLITIIGIIFFIGIYFILPADVDETYEIAMYAPELPPAFAAAMAEEGAVIDRMNSEEELKNAILNGDYQAGISLPADVMEIWAAGEKPDITIYYSSSAPEEIVPFMTTIVREMSYAQTGAALSYETTEEMLGEDMVGDQISTRERMRPLLVAFILLMEILSLSSLIATEIEQGTVRALMVTPMSIPELFTAKGILGIGLALIQALLFMLLVGGFINQPLITITTLIISSIMVVGIGFLLASLVRDVMAVTGWGMLVLIILALPGFGTAVPGLLSDWAKVIPSFYITDTLNRVINYSAGWGDVWLNLVILAVFSTAVLIAGMTVLRRRYQ